MTINRRNFLRDTILGTGMLASGLAGHAMGLCADPSQKSKGNKYKQRFNMSVYYAAPKLIKA